MRKCNKLLAWLLIFTMICTLMPVNAFAEENGPKPNIQREAAKKESKIIGEITEKREKNIKHFLKDNMTYEAVIYPAAVHYYENNEWKDIDNTLSEQQDEDLSSVL